MIPIWLEIIMAVSVVLTSIAGAIKLILDIYNNKPRLKLESAYFKKEKGKKYDFIPVKIILRNFTKSSTTIEKILITTGSLIRVPEFFKMEKISGKSSCELQYVLKFKKGALKKYFREKKIEFGVTIIHTFDIINKSAKTSFKTGHFTLK